LQNFIATTAAAAINHELQASAKRKRDSAQPQSAKRKRDSAQPQSMMIQLE
jgi:hypothetical protein